MNTNVKVIYNRKNKLDSNGEALVQVRAYASNGRYNFLSTGVKVRPEDWNPDKRCVRQSHPLHKELNGEIVRLLSGVMMNGIMQDSATTVQSFNEYCSVKLDKDRIIGNESRRNHHMTLNHLSKFNPNIQLSDVNQSLMNNFEQYLHSAGMANNTVVRHLKCVKKYINLLADDELITREKASSIRVKPKWEQTKFVFLTMEEVDAIADLDLKTDAIKKCRDAFLLSCFCGLRHSDIVTLKRSDVFEKDDGLYIYLGEMRKVKKQLYLPLYKFFDGRGDRLMRRILSEAGDDLLFPNFNSVKANVNVKVLAKAAGINKHITYHTSRHTFGTLLASETKDMFTVMTYMGHGSTETSLNYIHYSQLL